MRVLFFSAHWGKRGKVKTLWDRRWTTRALFSIDRSSCVTRIPISKRLCDWVYEDVHNSADHLGVCCQRFSIGLSLPSPRPRSRCTQKCPGCCICAGCFRLFKYCMLRECETSGIFYGNPFKMEPCAIPCYKILWSCNLAKPKVERGGLNLEVYMYRRVSTPVSQGHNVSRYRNDYGTSAF